MNNSLLAFLVCFATSASFTVLSKDEAAENVTTCLSVTTHQFIEIEWVERIKTKSPVRFPFSALSGGKPAPWPLYPGGCV